MLFFMHMNCHPGAYFCVLFIHVFIYLAALSLSCSMWDLWLWQVGSSSLRMNQTRPCCFGSTESYPLHHQESPFFTNTYTNTNTFTNTLLIIVMIILHIRRKQDLGRIWISSSESNKWASSRHFTNLFIHFFTWIKTI